MKNDELISQCCQAEIIRIEKVDINRIIRAKCSKCGKNLTYDLSSDTDAYFRNTNSS